MVYNYEAGTRCSVSNQGNGISARSRSLLPFRTQEGSAAPNRCVHSILQYSCTYILDIMGVVIRGPFGPFMPSSRRYGMRWPQNFATIGMLLGSLVIARSVVGEITYGMLLTLGMLFSTSFGATRMARWCLLALVFC